ncbi:MAG: MSCRAMM family adhesin SdrC [Holosporales bacterium]|nr:MSCRAMM family adhesin SdrC [Holosporales bacterium]
MRIHLLLFFVLCSLITGVFGETNFKAEAPKDPDDTQKYGFGSIWSGKEAFFKNNFGKKCKDKDVALNAKQVPTNTEMSKKDKVWNATLEILKSFSLTYVNKEAGVIKTDESYVHEFDNTDSCKYKVTVNITANGEVSVHITSSDDSQTRIKKHEELLKSRITSAALPAPNQDTSKETSQTVASSS